MDIEKIRQHPRAYPETFLTEKFTKGKSTAELLEFGIINIDKSSGPTSFNISDFVKKSLGLRKTAHFGTLDPRVTGVLPVALNRACKLTGYFLGEDKEYVGIMRMHEDISLDKIKEVIEEKFKGIIKQTPPVKSRVKRQEREREVKGFKLLEQERKDILFRVSCQGGTYIRKLCDDLGKELNMGAHMLELRRVRAGIFKEEGFESRMSEVRCQKSDVGCRMSEEERGRCQMSDVGCQKSEKREYPIVNLYDFEKAVEEYKKGNDELLRKIIIPAEIVSEVYKVVKVKKEIVENLWTGKPFFVNDVLSKPGVVKDEIVCVFAEDEFVGMFKVVKGKEIFAKSEFVMQPLN